MCREPHIDLATVLTVKTLLSQLEQARRRTKSVDLKNLRRRRNAKERKRMTAADERDEMMHPFCSVNVNARLMNNPPLSFLFPLKAKTLLPR